MPPQSRGMPPKPPPAPTGFQSRSTPNLPTLQSLNASGGAGNNAGSATANVNAESTHPEQFSPDIITSPSEPASIEDFSLDSASEPLALSPTSTDDEDGSEEEEPQTSSLPTRPQSHQYSRSHTHLAPLAFAPPFYNRPPTPLPPSPSLTSLLRPNFSSQNSRPTTPDPSSDEGTPKTGTQTPNSAAASTLTSSFRTAKPIPRASPKVPTYEYYGFTLYLTSSLTFIVYLLWSFLPSPFLHQLGIYYFPDRWWALAVPAWTVMLVIYIYVALASYNTGYLTLSMDSVECLVDEAANVAIVDSQGKLIHSERPSYDTKSPTDGKPKKKSSKGKNGGRRSRQGSLTKVQHQLSPGYELDWRTLWNEGTDAVMDIPIGGVCEILYGSHETSYDVSGNAHDR